MRELLTADALLSLATLTFLEIVLGIDNIIFISIVAGRLPAHQREPARRWGLAGAFVTRLLLLSALAWLAHLVKPLFMAFGREFSGKSLVLLLGGLFLLFKATREIHHKLEGDEGEDGSINKIAKSFAGVILEIMVIDMVFSLDSVITAVGMAQKISIMVAANVIALVVMLLVGGKVSAFIDRHPTVKILALSFLLMIGLALVADGIGFHIPKAYIYFSMAFSLLVESLNLRMGSKKNLASKKKAREPVQLRRGSPPGIG